jgi:hypothetical protein
MLNYNLNTLYTNRVSIEPILANEFNYFLIGGGGGGSAGGGSIGGKGGEGGKITTGSISVPHLSTFNITIATGGDGGDPEGGLGLNGGQTILNLNSSVLTFASGGLGNFNSGQIQDYNQVGLEYDYFNSAIWSGDGTKGGDSPSGNTGIGGGSGASNNLPWTTNPAPFAKNGLINTGAGGGGERWGQWPGGNGGTGLTVLSFLDPRDVFEYSGNYTYFEYDGNRKYFYFLNNGSFTFFGKRN